MSLANNLQYLRKKHKLTQEELADELLVSRQSISKWENGEAYPETEKLIVLCDKFIASMDDLVRGDIDDSECYVEQEKIDTPPPDEPKKQVIDITIAKNHVNSFAKGISLGVMLIIIGMACVTALSGASTIPSNIDLKFFEIIGACIMLVFIAAAVSLFIVYGI